MPFRSRQIIWKCVWKITFMFDLRMAPSSIIGSFIWSRITIFRTLNSVLVTFNPFGNFAPFSFVLAFSSFKNFLCRVIFLASFKSFYQGTDFKLLLPCLFWCRYTKNVLHVRLRHVHIEVNTPDVKIRNKWQNVCSTIHIWNTTNMNWVIGYKDSKLNFRSDFKKIQWMFESNGSF